ncbi:MAG: AraC family transcriptional regulator [Bacteroidota bacterium]
MGDIYERASGQKDVPHRHDYYTIMLIQSAKGKHIVDYQTFLFSNYEIHFVSPGQIHIVDLEEKPQGWVLTFSRDFLLENNIPESFISNINLFRGFGDSPPLKIDEQIFDRLFGILREMETCMPLELKYRNRALGAFLQLFLIFSSNSQNLDATQLKEDHKGVCILRDFKQLVESNYDQWHKVKNYASEIHISPKHLSQTVKDITGKTAKTFIQDRILLESKRLLLHTELNINEVAYQVGFEEPLHFSSFFKKRVGDSPTKFRERLTP